MDKDYQILTLTRDLLKERMMRIEAQYQFLQQLYNQTKIDLDKVEEQIKNVEGKLPKNSDA